jgi:hypothetical protein
MFELARLTHRSDNEARRFSQRMRDPETGRDLRRQFLHIRRTKVASFAQAGLSAWLRHANAGKVVHIQCTAMTAVLRA